MADEQRIRLTDLICPRCGRAASHLHTPIAGPDPGFDVECHVDIDAIYEQDKRYGPSTNAALKVLNTCLIDLGRKLTVAQHSVLMRRVEKTIDIALHEAEQRSAAASPSEPVLCDACGKDLDAESTAAAENARCHRTLGCSRERDHGGDCTPMANQPGDPTIRHVVAWMRQTYPQNQHAREWANEIERVFLRGAAASPEPCCYEAPAGIRSENCPTRADEASAPCRKCTECEGRHHWLETLAYVCKHCELLAEGCEECDGTGGLDGDVDSDAPCATCNGDGVIVPDQRRAAAKGDDHG